VEEDGIEESPGDHGGLEILVHESRESRPGGGGQRRSPTQACLTVQDDGVTGIWSSRSPRQAPRDGCPCRSVPRCPPGLHEGRTKYRDTPRQCPGTRAAPTTSSRRCSCPPRRSSRRYPRARHRRQRRRYQEPTKNSEAADRRRRRACNQVHQSPRWKRIRSSPLLDRHHGRVQRHQVGAVESLRIGLAHSKAYAEYRAGP